MIKKLNIIALVILLILGFTACFYIIKSTRAYKDTDLDILDSCLPYTEFNLNEELMAVDSHEIFVKFPYEKYLKESSYCDIKNINSHILTLDSIYNNHWDITLEVLRTTLTDSLKSYHENELEHFNPQFLINKVEWAKKMKRYGECFPENQYLFDITYEYWMRNISSYLGIYQSNESNLKYDYRFKYLTTNLSLEKYFVSFGFSKSQKLVNYLVEGRYMYIWNRIYKSTGIATKIILILMMLSTILAYLSLMNNIYKKLKK